MGGVDIDTTGDLWLRTSHGNATLGTAEGGIEITGVVFAISHMFRL